MLNQKLIKSVKTIIALAVIVSSLALGYFVGTGLKTKELKKIEQKYKAKDSKEPISIDGTITNEQVKDFLIAYYTKKDLGENRERYKPFLTEGMYNAIVSDEDKPTQKAYQGYIVDYEFEGADIFINQDKNEVIVIVKYKNTTLAKKDDRSKAITKSNKEAFKLTYTVAKDKVLVNKMDKILVENVIERN